MGLRQPLCYHCGGNMKKIVVLGAGYAGVEAAKKLAKKLGTKAEITLIDRNPFHTLMTELHELAGGRVEEEAVKISLNRIFAGSKVKVVIDNISTVDFESQLLKGQEENYSYDYLLISTGGDPECFEIPGIEEHGYTLWSYDDALAIRQQIKDCFLRASRESNEEKRRELLHFVIAGAGFTGMEMAGELTEWKKTLCRDYQVKEDEVSIQVVEAMDKILPMLPERLQHKAMRYLEKRGCEFQLNAPITGVEPGLIHIKDGKSIESSTMIWTCGVHGGEFAANLALTKGRCGNRKCKHASTQGSCNSKICEFAGPGGYISGKRGRLLVRETLQSQDYDNVYLAGDIIWHIQENKQVVPQIVETAVQSAHCAVENIASQIKSRKLKSFKPKYHGFMVSLGGRYGVAHLMGWLSLSGIFAMGVKHLINLMHFWGTAGLNQCWAYARHEFLDIKENRSFIWGLLSTKTRGHWVAVMRIFVGVMWLIEGIKKILDGWLDPNNIVIIPVDSATAASDAAAEVISYAQPFLFQEPSALYNWLVEVLISKAPYLFQAGLVIGEVIIGLAFIGGLFTVLAALASIVLTIMFTISAMAEKEILWYFFSGILFLGGAGRGSGLDHWVIPWFKKQWNRWPWVQRNYLYLDEPTLKKDVND